MTTLSSDAFVFFGATGDLAYKKIFPALLALIQRGNLDIAIIGVARAGWTVDHLRDRARDSLQHFGGADGDAFAKLSTLLQYIDGDYQEHLPWVKLNVRCRTDRCDFSIYYVTARRNLGIILNSNGSGAWEK